MATTSRTNNLSRVGAVTRVVQQGVSQQSPAVQHLIGAAFGGVPLPRAKRRTKRKSTSYSKPRKRRTSTKGALVKGSAAAKKRMAALRKMRK